MKPIKKVVSVVVETTESNARLQLWMLGLLAGRSPSPGVVVCRVRVESRKKRSPA